MTKRQYLAIKQRSGSSSRFDMFLGDIVDGFYTRRGCSCGGKIENEGDKAVCKLCGTIFNDGGNTDGMVVSVKIFFDGHHEAAPPPKPRKNKTAIHAIMRAVS